MKKYIIVTPVRNEEEFLEKTIKSVLKQTVKPAEYILVNDGSTDSTPEIIAKYVEQYDWIKTIDRPLGKHSPGTGVIRAFYAGFEISETKDWDFVIKLDGDLEFESGYFEYLIKAFEENPKLGIASGVTVEPKNGKLVMDKMPEDHTRGAAKMYSRELWDDIGGMPIVLGWDTLDELKAQTLGWETRSFKNLPLIHYKPIGFKQKKTFKRETTAGERYHYLGYHPLFALGLCVYRMKNKPFIIGGILTLYGYLFAVITRSEQIKDKVIIKHLRKKQIERLTFRRKLVG